VVELWFSTKIFSFLGGISVQRTSISLLIANKESENALALSTIESIIIKSTQHDVFLANDDGERSISVTQFRVVISQMLTFTRGLFDMQL
jgi:hypothetical protein